jgi:hypothetical protein
MSEDEVRADGECALERVWREIGIAFLLGSEFLEEVVTPAEPGPGWPERGVPLDAGDIEIAGESHALGRPVEAEMIGQQVGIECFGLVR